MSEHTLVVAVRCPGFQLELDAFPDLTTDFADGTDDKIGTSSMTILCYYAVFGVRLETAERKCDTVFVAVCESDFRPES